METPWDRARKRQQGTKPKHLRSELEGARGNDGKMQVNSGRFWHSKRDFRKFNFLFENRQTDASSYSVNGKELKWLTREAIFEQSLPAMRIDFTKLSEDWVLIRRGDFEDFFQALKTLEAMVENGSNNTDEI